MGEKKKHVPKRRFKEFENAEEWEERKLFNCVDKIIDFRGRTPKKLGLDWSNDGYLALSALNVKMGYIDPTIDAHYGNQKLYDIWMKGNELHQGQVLFTTEAPMGNVAQVPDNKGYILSQRTIAFEVTKDVITENYLAVSLASPSTFEKLSLLSSGGTAKGVSQKSLSEAYIPVPQNIEEQECISKYLKNLDNLITINQRKLDKLKSLKKAYITEMFPVEGERNPKLRFAGFKDDWEQRKWIETVDISTNMVDPKMGEFDALPHVGPGNIESFTGRLLNNVNSVKDDNLISGKFHFYKGDVIYGKINPQLGKYIFATFEGLASADAYVLNAKNGIEQTFLYSILQTKQFFEYSVSVSMRSGMPKINRDELNTFSFMAPSFNEQKEIGSLLLKLDNLITLHQRKLEKLQNIKKAYLNEMFI